MLKILHTSPSLDYINGGPSQTIVEITDELSNIDDLDISLFTVGKNNLSMVKSMNILSKRVFYPTPLHFLFKSNQFKSADLIHNHGIWKVTNHITSAMARHYKIPIIIQPRGMLEDWALKYKPIRKKLALTLYQKTDLESAHSFIATSIQEYENIRKLGLQQPIAIIPNGIVMPFDNQLDLLSKKINTKERTVLFLSRIHPKKGLINLIDAWDRLRPEGWRLKIVGPNEGHHLSTLIDRVEKANLCSVVSFSDYADSSMKHDLFQGANLFVLPTYSENFGVVIAEALSYGLPVITTKGAPWSELATAGCGWWIDIGVEPLVAALREALLMSEMGRVNMGKLGLEYVKKYNWKTIALETTEFYKWIIEGGSKPSFVRFD